MELNTFLIDYGFVNATSDASLFTYCKNEVLMYFLVYVDDLLLTESDSKEIESFAASLSTRFSLNDIGRLHYFLSVEAIFTKG